MISFPRRARLQGEAIFQLDSERVEFHRGLGMTAFPLGLPSGHESDAVITETDWDTLDIGVYFPLLTELKVPCEFFCRWSDST